MVVGNLTTGGNSKTPVMIQLMEQLQQRSIRVGVVSRGYGGRADRYLLVLTDRTSTTQVGNESVLVHQRTGAPVAVFPLRGDAVKTLLSVHDLQIIVTDNGLQHYKLTRGREIVVIDDVHRSGNGWWLPAGPMRERALRLQSADAVIVSGGVARPGEIPMQLHLGMAANLLIDERHDILTFTSTVATAGIGHPPCFFATLESCGIQPVKTMALAGHQALNQADVATLVAAGQTLLMTEKDAVKYRNLAVVSWWYLLIDAIMADERAQRLLTDLATLTQR